MTKKGKICSKKIIFGQVKKVRTSSISKSDKKQRAGTVMVPSLFTQQTNI
jgi:hypothetical protein